MRTRLLLALAVCGVFGRSAVAHSQPDNRPSDRFFFGLGIGAVGGSEDRFNVPEEVGGLAVGYETSYWPNDYVGVGFDFHFSRTNESATTITATTIDLGLPLVVGLPLRWVQPYAGAWLGLERTYFYETASDTTTTDGFHKAIHPVAGLNGYLSRNLRVFLQWQGLGHRDSRCALSFLADPDCSTSAFTQELLVGLRSSPDWFHKKRGRIKFQIVYWSVAATVLLWGLTIWEN